MTWLLVCYISPSQLCFFSRLSLQAHTSETGNGKNFMLILYLSLFPWLPSSLKSPAKKKPCCVWADYRPSDLMSLSNYDQSLETDRSALLSGADGSCIPTRENRGRAGSQACFFPWVKGTFSKWDFITVSSECESPHLCGISSSSTNYGHLCHEEQGN